MLCINIEFFWLVNECVINFIYIFFFSRLQLLWDIICNFFRNLSPQRLAILIAVVAVIVGVILMLGLLPASFVYVEYHEVQWCMLSGLTYFIVQNGKVIPSYWKLWYFPQESQRSLVGSLTHISKQLCKVLKKIYCQKTTRQFICDRY